MKKYFVDASVILKTIPKESDSVSKRFGKILKEVKSGKVELFSQKFLTVEVANGFRYGTNDVSEALEYFDVFIKLPIKYLNLTKMQQRKTIEVSYELRTTVYDTSYHISAKAHGATFSTCDEQYYKKAKSLGDIEFLG